MSLSLFLCELTFCAWTQEPQSHWGSPHPGQGRWKGEHVKAWSARKPTAHSTGESFSIFRPTFMEDNCPLPGAAGCLSA